MKQKYIKLNNLNFCIRLLKSDDEKILAEFFINLSDEITKWYTPHSFTKEVAKEICRERDQKYKRVIIIHNGIIVGYCILFFGIREWDDYRYEWKLIKEDICTIAPCITDNFQNMGLGSEMIKYIIETCHFFKKKMIILWGGVVIKNKKAVDFYKKMNFVIDREWLHPKKNVQCYDMHLNISSKAQIQEKKNNVMIIGAGGSLGLELCELLSNNNNIIAVDINENNLMFLYRSYNIPIFIEDLQNFDKLKYIIRKEKVDTVINCAASKHVRWCEKNIKRAININILSNLDLIYYLKEQNKRFIYISSDKAIKPKNIYALTKQFTDYIVEMYNFKLVRGVNFLNSKGSVLDIWDRQRRENISFSVVKENCKRYFITISEMANLVKEALEDDSNKVIYTSSQVYRISIHDLFKAYLKFNNIKNYTIEEFPLSYSEKLVEHLDFNPMIINMNDISEIIKLLRKTYK